jgi:tripartite-type tricarboxylate transporter receptor subunit TctC
MNPDRNRSTRNLFALALSLSAGLNVADQCHAQTSTPYPNQMVRIVVPFAAGSTTDLLARTVADRLSTRWQQKIVVENRPGIAGTASVAKAQPDGYTVLMVSNGHAVIDRINATLPFDPIKDFVGISKIASLPLVLVVPPSSSASSLSGLVDIARAHPGKMSYASAGLGGVSHVASELLKQIAKIDIVHVPYRGAPDAHTSVVRGDTQMCFTPVNVGAELIKSGRLRALAISGRERSPGLPDISTFSEAGMPEFVYEAWFGLLAPADTPPQILKKINDDVDAIFKSEEMVRLFAAQGVTPVSSTPAEFTVLLKAESVRMRELLPKAQN